MIGGECAKQVRMVRDADFVRLAEFSKLRCLSLSGEFTDAGVARLHELVELRAVNLKSDQMTDQVIDGLLDLPRLKWLGISGSQITDSGRASRARRADCQVGQFSWTGCRESIDNESTRR